MNPHLSYSYKLLSCSTISLERRKRVFNSEFFNSQATQYSYKKLSNFISRCPNWRQYRSKRWTNINSCALRTLQRPQKTPGLDPTALIFLYCLSLRLTEDFKLFKFMIDLKVQSPSFHINFLDLRVVFETIFHVLDINISIN